VNGVTPIRESGVVVFVQLNFTSLTQCHTDVDHSAAYLANAFCIPNRVRNVLFAPTGFLFLTARDVAEAAVVPKEIVWVFDKCKKKAIEDNRQRCGEDVVGKESDRT
jgi:hypothetical protein